MILNQRKFTYNTCMAIMYFFRCRNCRSRENLRRIKSAEKDFKLNKGEEKLFQDLDIVKLLQMIKDYRVMKQVIFTHDDLFFLQLQHRDMICSSSSEQETENKFFKQKSKPKLIALNSTELDMNISDRSSNKSMPALKAS